MNERILDKDTLFTKYIVENMSLTQVKTFFKCSLSSLKRNLYKYNIPIRTKSFLKTKYSVHHEYFKEPTIDNCYWAGFISADGNISSIVSNKSQYLTIGLHPKDKNLLEKFKEDIKYTGIISITDRVATLKIYSQIIANNLKEHFNITPKKSLTLQPPNITDKEQILSYIIGIIDGDGCIKLRIQKNKTVCNKIYLSFYVIGTKELLEWINLHCNNLGRLYQKTKNKNTYCLEFKSQDSYILLSKFKKHIIKYDLYYLNRKWDKIIEYENYLQLPRVI